MIYRFQSTGISTLWEKGCTIFAFAEKTPFEIICVKGTVCQGLLSDNISDSTKCPYFYLINFSFLNIFKIINAKSETLEWTEKYMQKNKNNL